MAHLIDKSALVAEIEKRIKEYKSMKIDFSYYDGMIASLEFLRDEFIDTLEVKEVDLDGERRKYLTEHFNVYEDGILQSKRSNLPLDTYDVIKFAKHFFELGLQSQNEEKIVIEEEGTCNTILNRIVGKSWNLICPVHKMNVNNGEKVKIRIIKGK